MKRKAQIIGIQESSWLYKNGFYNLVVGQIGEFDEASDCDKELLDHGEFWFKESINIGGKLESHWGFDERRLIVKYLE